MSARVDLEPSARIVVAEASPASAERLARVLTDAGCEVVAARTGEDTEGVAFWSTTDPRDLPDVAVLAMSGADGNGLRVLQKIREHDRSSRTRVLMLVDEGARADAVVAFGAGADDCLCRPFGDEELIARVGNLVRARRAELRNAELLSQLHDTAEKLDGLIASSFDAVIAIDADDNVIVFNTRAEDMLGYREHEMLGHTVAKLHPDIEVAKFVRKTVDERGSISDFPVTLHDNDGHAVPILLSARLIRGKQGNVIGQAGFMKDMREMRLLEDRLHALIAASTAIASARDLDEVLDEVVRSAVGAFPSAKWGGLFLLDPSRDALAVAASTGRHTPGAEEALRCTVGEGLAGWTFENNETVMINDVLADGRYRRWSHPDIPEPRSAICAPLRAKGEAVGVLILANPDATGAFSRDDLSLLDTFAEQAAICIADAINLEELQKEAESRALLQNISTGISAQTEIGEILQSVVEGAARLLGVEMAVVHLVTDSADGVSRSIAVPSELATLMTPPRAKEGLTAEVVRSGEVVVIPDTCRDERVNPEVIKVGIRSLVGFPLTIRGEVSGALFLNSTERHSFGKREIGLVSLLANQAGIAIENAELIAADRRRLAKLESLSAASNEIMKNFHSIPPQDRLDLILKHLARILEAEATSLFLVKEPGFVTKAACYGHVEKHYQVGRRYEITTGEGTGLTGHIAAEGKIFRAHGAELESHPAVAHKQVTHVPSATCTSVLALPLWKSVDGHESLVGLIEAENKLDDSGRPNADVGFTGEDVWILTIFAESVATCLENADLFARTSDELERRVDALGALYEAGKAISSSLTLNQILHRILEQARTLTGVTGEDAGSAYLGLVQNNKLRFEVTLPESHLEDLHRQIGEIDLSGDGPIGVTGRVAKTKTSQLVHDVADDPDYIEFVRSVRSACVVPMMIGDEVIGVIDVEHTEPEAFDEDDCRVLELLASEAALAIRNARQYQLLEGLLQAGHVVTAGGELFPALNAIADTVRQVTASDVVTMYTYSEEDDEISYPSIVSGELWEPDRRADWELVRLERRLKTSQLEDRSVIRRLIEAGESRFAQDAAADPILGGGEFVEREGIRSSAAILLRIEDRIVGLLFLNYRAPRAFNREERTALELFATEAALAIDNARRYEELRRAKGLVGSRTALAWMGMASAVWRHSISKHAVTIKDQAALLGRDLGRSASPVPLGDSVADRIATIRRLADQIVRKPITLPLSAEEGAESVPVNGLVGERARQLWQSDPYNMAKLQLDLQLPDSGTVWASREWLRRALDVLVDNAVNAVRHREVKEIVIGTRLRHGACEVFVSDTGPGIPGEVLRQIGWQPVSKSKDASGLGHGLLMAQAILETYGGEIGVDETGPTGTTMVARLPLERLASDE